MRKVLVIGASGMVASRFIEMSANKIEVVGVDEKIIDITDNAAVNGYFVKNKFDSVINFAAFTNVDGAELQKGDENGLCYRLNVLGVNNIIENCKKYNIHFVQISTDFIFPGNSQYPGPYTEKSKLPNDQSGIGWYGWTKCLAEKSIIESGINYSIVRITYPFMAKDYGLKLDWARNLIKLYNEQKLYPLFQDQQYSILFIDELFEPLFKIVDKKITGIFHVASVDTVTPYESGKYLLESYSGKNVDIQKGSFVEYMNLKTRSPRPQIGGLNTSETEKKLGIKFKTWKQMIMEFVDQFKSSSV